jgi:Flp pilus assembly protein TadD
VAHTNLGVLLAATQRRAEAELCHRRALALQPDSASAHTNLGLVLLDLARLDEAEPHLRRALALAPGSAEVHSNLGNLLARRGSDAEAEQCLRRALVLDPTLAAAHCNLGVLLADQRRDAPAEAHFRSAIALRPGYALARLDLSCLLLAQGRFKEGWTLHEARHDPQLPDNGIAPPNVSFPAWRGEPLAGRSLLIWAEQGLGDQIQFCRYVPRLKAQGAARITLVCQRVLASLLGTLPGIDVVLPADVVDNAFHVEAAAIAVHDTWVFPLSLPLWLGTDLSTLPAAPIPYLSADPARVGAWTRRVHDDERGRPAKMLRVGLVWRGNPMHHNDAERSLPGLSTLTPLWSVPNCRFVSLQTGRAAAEADTPPGALPLVALGAELGDFADSAAALAALDLLICVDTSIAHLAGALGLPCWVLLPRHRTDWRWLRDRDDSPWYPRGMRLFRQARRGDWAEVVERVRAALVPTAARSGSTP